AVVAQLDLDSLAVVETNSHFGALDDAARRVALGAGNVVNLRLAGTTLQRSSRQGQHVVALLQQNRCSAEHPGAQMPVRVPQMHFSPHRPRVRIESLGHTLDSAREFAVGEMSVKAETRRVTGSPILSGFGRDSKASTNGTSFSGTSRSTRTVS